MQDTEEPATDDSKPITSPRAVYKEALSTVGILLSAALLAFILISFVFQTYQVSGISMEPTLQNDNHLLVWKMPRTWARITGHAYAPARGNIIILNETAKAHAVCENDQGNQLVKRVIGLPGDHVVVANGAYTVYDKQHPNGFDPDKTLPYGKGLTESTNHNIDVRLGKNQIFVSGDNRQESCDSRLFGPVNVNQVIGKVAIRVLPLSELGIF